MRSTQFSWTITITSLGLASAMLWCSSWQWDRYQKKVKLVESYRNNSTAVSLKISPDELASDDLSRYLNQKIELTGSYDYERELIVTNKKHASGPGHWLLTPFKIAGSDRAIFVSRGFIPFTDRTPDSWIKYRGVESETLQGVVKPTLTPRLLGPKNPELDSQSPDIKENPLGRLWYFEEIQKMARGLPYPAITGYYLQRIGNPLDGEFPAEAVTIEVPPSTHLGYTIEWIILAIVTVAVGTFLQLFPQYRLKNYGLRKGTNDPSRAIR